ncbi:MAG: hypothetical protein Q9214_008030, partial [Letrouitia sp. 1 TL-2023]
QNPSPCYESPFQPSVGNSRLFRRDLLCCVLVSSVLSALLGLTLGRNAQTHLRQSDFPVAKASQSVFVLNETFIEGPSPRSNEAWASLIPGILAILYGIYILQANVSAGRGFVAADSLGKPLLYDEGRQLDLTSARAVSVFHQLHCLNELRIGFYSPDFRHGDDVNTADQHAHSTAHMKHCFDYLRQALMCAADLTLEPLRSPREGSMPGVNGWGVGHICRDWEGVREWTEKRRATGQSGIE